MRANPIDEYFGELVIKINYKHFVTKKIITKNLGDLYLGNTNQLTSTIQNSNYFPCFFYFVQSIGFSHRFFHDFFIWTYYISTSIPKPGIYFFP